MKSTIHRALILTILWTLAVSAQGQEPRDRLPIIDKAITYHGGERYEASHTELDICSKSGCFHIEVRRDGGLFEYDVTGKVRDGERRVQWSNDRLEVRQNGRVIEVADDDAQGFKDWVSARIYFPFLPYRLNDPSVYKTDLGLETWNGRSLHRVKVTFEAGSSTDASDEYVYWLDPDSGRVEQFAYSYEGNPGGLRFRRAVNHRREGGLLFFDQENLGVEGEGLSVDQINPSVVAEMRSISVVRLEKISVRPLSKP